MRIARAAISGDVFGSRLLQTYSTNTLQSGSPPGHRLRETGLLLTAYCLLITRRRTWSCNRLRNHLLQLSPMKGIANDRQRYQEEANQKNRADTVGKPVAVLRAVLFGHWV